MKGLLLSKKKPSWLSKWSDEQLTADLAVYRARDWARALKAYEKNPTEFYVAWDFLAEHPANRHPENHFSMWCENFDVMVAKVDPETHRVESRFSKKGKNLGSDPGRNTLTEVWVEWGPWVMPSKDDPYISKYGMRSHDYRVDTGAETFEQAVINLAHNVWMLYRDKADTPNDAKLKKKDRW